MSEKKYEFRELNSKDLFLITRLVKKIGINKINKYVELSTIGNLINTEGHEEDYVEIGLNLALGLAQLIVESLDNIENELYSLLVSTSNKTLEELYSMDLDVFIEMIYDFVKLDSFKKVFTKVVSLLNTAN